MWRLRIQLVFLAVLLVVLAGCSDEVEVKREAPLASAPTPAGVQQVEVFSWWTRGRESAGLDALVQVLARKQPEIRFVNAASAVESDADAQAALVERLLAGSPPDSWQAPVGGNTVAKFAQSGYLEPLNFLYVQRGWEQAFPAGLLRLLESNGNRYSLPVSVHRTNVLWYRPDLLAAAGIPQPETLDDLLLALETLRGAGMEAPLALGEQWTILHLWETVLLASLGPDAYDGLWTGETAWDGPEMAVALDTFARLLSFATPDHAELTWEEAAQRLNEGSAAFYVMGDWLEPYLRSQGLESPQQLAWTAFPGTRGMFQFTSEGFVLATGAGHRHEALSWLDVVGSVEGQQAFNLAGGAMPARVDVERSLFGDYWRAAMEDWATNRIVGGLLYGVAGTDAWRSEVDAAMTQFLANGDIEGFQQALAAACSSEGNCG